MIKNSFIFLEKIGRKKEQSLWQQGIKDWSTFLNADNNSIKGIPPIKKEYYGRKIKEAQQAILENNAFYFSGKLPKIEMWRLYPSFKDESCFLDIEVDSKGDIILVGISDYYHSNFFMKGINLSSSLLITELSKYKLMITFNGSSFDLPKLKKQLNIELRNVELQMAHIDIKPLCINLGLKGGLKEVEKVLNLKRPSHLYGNPVELWKAFHASGDKEYLDLLIEYNREDIENLKGVMDWCYREKSGKIYKQLKESDENE